MILFTQVTVNEIKTFLNDYNEGNYTKMSFK